MAWKREKILGLKTNLIRIFQVLIMVWNIQKYTKSKCGKIKKKKLLKILPAAQKSAFGGGSKTDNWPSELMGWHHGKATKMEHISQHFWVCGFGLAVDVPEKSQWQRHHVNMQETSFHKGPKKSRTQKMLQADLSARHLHHIASFEFKIFSLWKPHKGRTKKMQRKENKQIPGSLSKGEFISRDGRGELRCISVGGSALRIDPADNEVNFLQLSLSCSQMVCIDKAWLVSGPILLIGPYLPGRRQGKFAIQMLWFHWKADINWFYKQRSAAGLISFLSCIFVCSSEKKISKLGVLGRWRSSREKGDSAKAMVASCMIRDHLPFWPLVWRRTFFCLLCVFSFFFSFFC